MVRSVNDNATYHLTELDGMQTMTLIARKRVMAFKRRNEAKPSLGADNASSGEEEE